MSHLCAWDRGLEKKKQKNTEPCNTQVYHIILHAGLILNSHQSPIGKNAFTHNKQMTFQPLVSTPHKGGQQVAVLLSTGETHPGAERVLNLHKVPLERSHGCVCQVLQQHIEGRQGVLVLKGTG